MFKRFIKGEILLCPSLRVRRSPQPFGIGADAPRARPPVVWIPRFNSKALRRHGAGEAWTHETPGASRVLPKALIQTRGDAGFPLRPARRGTAKVGDTVRVTDRRGAVRHGARPSGPVHKPGCSPIRAQSRTGSNSPDGPLRRPATPNSQCGKSPGAVERCCYRLNLPQTPVLCRIARQMQYPLPISGSRYQEL